MRSQRKKHMSKEDAYRFFKLRYSDSLPFMGPVSAEMMWGGFIKDEINAGNLPTSAKSWPMPAPKQEVTA